MATIRVRAAAALVGVAALVLATTSGAGAPNPDLKAPKLLAPAPYASVEAGAGVTFKIRTHVRDVGLVLRVSHSAVRATCGVIRGDVARYSFVRTGTPAVYQARPAGAALTTSWLSTPGTYYWQAYRLAGRDGCVESSVRSLKIAPKPPLALTEARVDGTFEVTSRVTAVEGFKVAVGDTDKITYTLTPVCTAGACDTSVSFKVAGITPLVTKTVTIPLTRSGTAYTGSGPAALSKCSFVDVTGTLEIRLEVSSATWRGSTWLATGIVGHERYSTTATGSGIFTCPGGSWEADLNGTLRGSSAGV